MGFLSGIFKSAERPDFADLIRHGAIVVDVRSAGEFASGHIQGSVNIPLEKIQTRIADLKKSGRTVITCCRSGNRSGLAKSMLVAAGVNAVNGGAWTSLQHQIRK